LFSHFTSPSGKRKSLTIFLTCCIAEYMQHTSGQTSGQAPLQSGSLTRGGQPGFPCGLSTRRTGEFPGTNRIISAYAFRVRSSTFTVFLGKFYHRSGHLSKENSKYV